MTAGKPEVENKWDRNRLKKPNNPLETPPPPFPPFNVTDSQKERLLSYLHKR